MTALDVLVRAAAGPRRDALAWLALADAVEEAGVPLPWHDAEAGARAEIPALAFRLVGGIAAGPCGLTAGLDVEEACKRICRCRSPLQGVIRVLPRFESVCHNAGLSARRHRRRAGLRVTHGTAPAEGGSVACLDGPVADDVPIMPGFAVLSWTEPVSFSPSLRSLEVHAHPLDVPALVLGRR